MLTARHGGYLAFMLTDEVTSDSLTDYQVFFWTEDVCRRIPMVNRVHDNPRLSEITYIHLQVIILYDGVGRRVNTLRDKDGLV